MEKVENPNPLQDELYQDPENLVRIILQEMMMSWSVDQEPTLIEDILKKYHNGLISGPEAVAEARRIADSRQDYH